MGLLAILRSFSRRDVDDASGLGEAVVDLGGEELRTAQHFTPAGIDARPRPGDYVAGVEVGRQVVLLGHADPSGGIAGAGEVRVYARNGDGAGVAAVHVKADGSVLITNEEGGSIEMATNGDVTINGVLIDTDGNVVAPGEVTAKDGPGTSVGLSTHLHGTAMGPSDAPTPGT